MAENITAVDAFKAMIENSKQLTEINNLLKSQCDFTASTHKYVKQIAANLNEIKELMERAEVQTQKLPETAPIENPYKRKISSFPENSTGSGLSPPYIPGSIPPPPRRVLHNARRLPPGKCLACLNKHSFSQCNVYRDHISRAKFLADNGLCKYCTERISVCTSEGKPCSFQNRKCQSCHQPHQNALCPLVYPVLPVSN